MCVARLSADQDAANRAGAERNHESSRTYWGGAVEHLGEMDLLFATLVTSKLAAIMKISMPP